MALTAEDQALVSDMKQRELHLKRRQRATDAIHFELRRYRTVLVVAMAALFGCVEVVIYLTMVRPLPERPSWWLPAFVNFGLMVLLGVLVGSSLLRRRWGRRLLARKEGRLRTKYSGDLESGRRWLQFYYQDQEISAYVPQILYFIEQEQRFDSVREALAFAKHSRRERGSLFAERARARFDEVVAQTNKVVLSSTDESGRPSSRVMRFVKTDQPGVWYLTTAPQGPKVRELDRGAVALVTSPTDSGATISSNQVRVRRSGLSFADVADLYRDQVPGYTDGMTAEEQERELVYELTLQSAKVETWIDHDVVEFSG